MQQKLQPFITITLFRLIAIQLFLIISISTLGQQWSQPQRIVVPDSSYNARFGAEVAVSDSFLVIGTPYNKIGDILDTSTVSRSGAVYVYKREGNAYTYWQKLFAPIRKYNILYGSNLALTDDQLIVGSFNHPAAAGTGKVFIYSLDLNGKWILSQELVPQDTSFYFGQGIDIEGNLLAIGAWVDKKGIKGDSNVPAGAVYIYKKINTDWTFSHKITSSTRGQHDQFGLALDLHKDKLIVGAPGRNRNEGAAYLFRLENDTFRQINEILLENQLRPSTTPEFGRSVLLSDDYLFIGAPGHDYSQVWTTEIKNFGMVYVYDTQDSIMKVNNRLFHNQNASNSYYGSKLEVGSDFLFIGSPSMDSFYSRTEKLPNSGGLTYKANQFSATNELIPNELSEGDAYCASINHHNGILAVGSPKARCKGSGKDSLNVCGAVYIYHWNESASTSEYMLKKKSGYPNPSHGYYRIDIDGSVDNTTVVNSLGQIITDYTVQEFPGYLLFDFTNCATDIYFMHIQGSTYKVILLQD